MRNDTKICNLLSKHITCLFQSTPKNMALSAPLGKDLAETASGPEFPCLSPRPSKYVGSPIADYGPLHCWLSWQSLHYPCQWHWRQCHCSLSELHVHLLYLITGAWAGTAPAKGIHMHMPRGGHICKIESCSSWQYITLCSSFILTCYYKVYDILLTWTAKRQKADGKQVHRWYKNKISSVLLLLQGT